MPPSCFPHPPAAARGTSASVAARNVSARSDDRPTYPPKIQSVHWNVQRCRPTLEESLSGGRLPSITDVALHAGVSRSAVSRVLNDQPGVALATRAKIEGAINALGYRPNSQAQSLRTTRTHVLGLILPTLALPSMPEIVQGAAAAAHSHGYLLTVGDLHDDSQLRKAYVDELLRRRVDGLICLTYDPVDEILRPARTAGVPVLLLGRASAAGETLSQVNEAHDAFREAFSELLQLGHRRIGFITLSSGMGLFRLLRHALNQAGIPGNPDLERVADTPDEVRSAVDGLMALKDPPTALLVSGVLSASAAGSHLAAKGFNIPVDLSLIGVRDSDWARNSRPRLDVICAATVDDSRAATELLIRHIEGDTSAPLTVTSTFAYVHRDSVGPATRKGDRSRTKMTSVSSASHPTS